ncbi:hypothetical protein [Halostella salina]|uniref:hypothetical protein n=1 Tax=Halostella salina TaxID=1547897 RepID=UPI0013CE6506|nr:hypothetical protein [Halostella salina]
MTVDTIRRRDAADGCGCVRCRDLDAAVVRHSVADDVWWTVRLLQRHPSVPVIVVGLVAGMAAIKPVTASVEPSTGPASWIGAPAHTALAVLLLGVFLRGYVGAVVAGELTGHRPSVRDALAHTGRRGVPLFATVLAILLVLLLAFVLAIAVVSLLVFQVGLLGPGVFDGLTPTLLFGSILAVVFYKCWMAPDVCVVGGTGPVTALRVSWRVTTAHWRRVCVLLLSFVVSVGGPPAVAAALAALGGGSVSAVPGTNVLVDLWQWLSTVVWYGVGVQVYARSTVD